MYDLTLTTKEYSPVDGVTFHFGEITAGAASASAVAHEKGFEASSEFSFGMIAEAVRAVDGLSDDGVEVFWGELGKDDKVEVLKRIPHTWFNKLLESAHKASDPDKEEEIEVSE